MGTAHASCGLLKTAGGAVLAFAALGAHLFYSALSVATGGPAVPTGRPLQRS
jgi:hypothetical protein